MDKEKDEHRSVDISEAKYGVILYSGYDTTVIYYDSKEDLEWALLNSYYNANDVQKVFKVLKLQVSVDDHE